jgi:hypothetical protein
VSGELSHGLSGLDVPESQGLVPRGGNAEVTVHGEGNIGHKVVVAGELSLGNTNNSFLGFLVKVPGHQGFITGS